MGLLTLKIVTDMKESNYELFEFHGELDQSTIPNAEKEIEAKMAESKRRYFVFDFADLKFVNSEGIGFLVSMHMKLMKKGHDLVLCAFRKNVADVINLIGLPKLVKIFGSLAEALAYIQKT